jgi:hypothetical protein
MSKKTVLIAVQIIRKEKAFKTAEDGTGAYHVGDSFKIVQTGTG